MVPSDLEGRLGPVSRLKKATGRLRKAADYMLPFLDNYDAYGQADLLLQDPAVRARGLDTTTVAGYLAASRQKYSALFTCAKIADTADRLTSVLGAILKGSGVLFGGLPGIAANYLEEAVEIFVFKTPFYVNLWNEKEHRHRLPALLAKEFVTSAIPVLSDAYDIITNMYMKSAYGVIRDDARQNILAGTAQPERITSVSSVPSLP